MLSSIHVAPRPVSTGVSFRKLPTVSCQSIVEVCAKYRRQLPPPEVETRCSRFLDECCRDVTALALQLQHRTEVELCELRRLVKGQGTVTREWSEAFAHQGVRPLEVLKRLVSLEEEVASLRAELARCESRETQREKKYQAQVDVLVRKTAPTQ